MSQSLLNAHISVDVIRTALAASNTYEDITTIIAPAVTPLIGTVLPVQPQSHFVDILTEMVSHAVQTTRPWGLSTEATNTFINILLQTHIDSMQEAASMKQSYNIFQSYMVSHTVHRPPYSTAVFTLAEASVINEYVLSTYIRHYRMYLHVFTPRKECTLKCAVAKNPNEIPRPAHQLNTGMVLKEWEVKQAEIRKAKELEDAKRRQEEEEQAAHADAERKKQQKLSRQSENENSVPGTLSAQLNMIRETVGKASSERFDEIETKIASLESKLSEAIKTAQLGKKGPGKK
eukprot:PhF_6_TR28142/c0_g1_i1/m.41677